MAIIKTGSGRHSIAPTLNLDFAKNKFVDPRISFDRPSHATYYDEKGVVRTASHNVPRFNHDPVTGECKGLLVEELRTNHSPCSQNIYYQWIPNSAGIRSRPSNVLAPDGTMSATYIKFSSSNQAYSLTNSSAWSAGTEVTSSIWVKGNAGETISIASGGVDGYHTLTGGWDRVSITKTSVNTTTNINTYSGMTAREVHVWGAQAETAAIASSYIPSYDRFGGRSSKATMFNKDGMIEYVGRNVPRYGYAYDFENEKWTETGLIIEQSSINKLTNSAMKSIVPNYSLPSGAGTCVVKEGWMGFDKYLKFTNASAWVSLAGAIGTGVMYDSKTWVGSFYSDKPTAHSFYLSPQSGYITTGVIPVGPGLYRHWVEWYNNTGVTSNLNPHISNGGDWIAAGFQVEELVQGRQPTSWIPTYGVEKTRSTDTMLLGVTAREADVVTYWNIDKEDWFDKEKGTLVVEAEIDYNNSDQYGNVVQLVNNGASGQISLSAWETQGRELKFLVYDNSNNLDANITPATFTVGTPFRIAASYETNSGDMAANGILGTSDTSMDVPEVDQMRIGVNLFGHVKRVSYYPIKLTNDELKVLSEND